MRSYNILLSILLIATACSKQEEKQSTLLPHSIKAAQGQKQARGFVFNDINENRKMDDSEKGIAGIAVSNGIDIVQTNEAGEYEIPSVITTHSDTYTHERRRKMNAQMHTYAHLYSQA